ncbi:MAG: hypothetical protein RMK20_09015, partial [Verrucomicrobiales bacterium]|nr:hypothetical protein [Verrucomicrobiales bacterium]
MKLQRAPTRSHGNILIVSLVLAAILGVTLAGYLIMTQAQNAAVARSQMWNSAIVVSEAGVEDALALINKYAGNYDEITNWCKPASIAADNWTQLGNNTYYVRRFLGQSYYDVYITNINNSPVINSRGYVPWAYVWGAAGPLLASANTPNASQPRYLSRKLEVQTKYDALFAVAMAAVQVIDMNGNNVTTDSFDSADPNHSINGLYPFSNPSMVKSNGDVCTLATITNSINIGNANIKGVARTGPNGTVSIGPNGYVTGGVYNDFNVVFPDVVLPTTSWLPVATRNYRVGGKTYDYAILTSGDFWLNSLSTSLYIGSNINVRLLLLGNVNLTGQDEIRIARNSQVRFYMSGSNFRVNGNGLVNDNGNAASFFYFGLPGNTAVEFGGNGTFVGAIYAPQAAFQLNGGGSTP